MKKISKQFRQGALTIIFLGDSSGLALKLQKVDPIFYKFQSVSILAIRSNGWQETVSMP